MMRTIWIVALSLTLGACAQTVPVDTSCTAFRIIPYHALTDAPDTIQRIREHNAAWRSLCAR